VIRPAGINRLAAIGATTAVLWLSPVAYAEMERLAGGSL
jgi:hypothetical protein